jgi:hypothetical protein
MFKFRKAKTDDRDTEALEMLEPAPGGTRLSRLVDRSQPAISAPTQAPPIRKVTRVFHPPEWSR